MTQLRFKLTAMILATFAIAATICLAAPMPAPAKADVSYGPHPHQLLDVYLPSKGDGPFPVLVWYGGLWKPSKGVPDPNRFLSAGCAMVAVQTRVMQDGIDAKEEAPVAVCLLDACRAVQFVRLHAAEWKIDPSRIAVGGGSQGALPALYVGTAGDKADAKSADSVERVSTAVVGVGGVEKSANHRPAAHAGMGTGRGVGRAGVWMQLWRIIKAAGRTSAGDREVVTRRAGEQGFRADLLRK